MCRQCEHCCPAWQRALAFPGSSACFPRGPLGLSPVIPTSLQGLGLALLATMYVENTLARDFRVDDGGSLSPPSPPTPKLLEIGPGLPECTGTWGSDPVAGKLSFQ